MRKQLLTSILFLTGVLIAGAQNKVGLNTNDPSQAFELSGSGVEYMRLHTRSIYDRKVGLEFVRGLAGPARDWRILKSNDDLLFQTNDDNFATGGDEIMRFTGDGKIGIGTQYPSTRVHIESGEVATNTLDGSMVLGTESTVNMVLSLSNILVRNNGNPAGLYLQGHGGHTYFGFSGLTNTLIPNGKLSVGGYSTSARLNIEDDLWQLQLNNWELTQNNWFVGASSDSWIVGDDQLVFSPTSTSSNALFRLTDVTENDGITAPVAILSGSGHTLLMDGNEMDGKNAPLYFNFNSEEDVYLNAQGGSVGISTNTPDAKLHINSALPIDYNLVLENGTAKWQFMAHGDKNVYFYNQGILRAYISWSGGGSWVQASDRRLKEHIRPLTGAMDLIRQIRVKRYVYLNDPGQKDDIGVIAQEVQEVVPEAVFEEEGRWGVNYDQLTVIALEGVKEQQARLMALQVKIAEALNEF